MVGRRSPDILSRTHRRLLPNRPASYRGLDRTAMGVVLIARSVPMLIVVEGAGLGVFGIIWFRTAGRERWI